jgi:16S rRNA (cytosine1402-N4)-methyltransferase
MSYHDPVLAKESIDALAIMDNGIYVDATFGGGGHARLIMDALGENGRLIGFDQDMDASQNLLNDQRFTFVQHNFRFLKRFLRLHAATKVHGILADLGVSSHQLDIPERGFSFRFDADLDMRMNQHQEVTAASILKSYSAEALQSMFSRYGEVRNAKTLAQRIVEARKVGHMDTVGKFLQLLEPLIRGQRSRYLAQVFQALRIEVNDEMGALEDFLQQALEALHDDGRLVIISYHSIEDRMVKNFFKTGNIKGIQEKDFYGNITRPFKVLTRKALLPTEQEIKNNPRARSAKLRVAQKLSIDG